MKKKGYLCFFFTNLRLNQKLIAYSITFLIFKKEVILFSCSKKSTPRIILDVYAPAASSQFSLSQGKKFLTHLRVTTTKVLHCIPGIQTFYHFRTYSTNHTIMFINSLHQFPAWMFGYTTTSWS